MKIRKGDKVKVIAGKNKGSEGVVERVYYKKDKVLVEGINIVTKHVKPTGKTAGGITKVNRPVHVSNVVLVDEKDSKPIKIGYRIVDGKKYRVSKVNGELIDKK